MTQQFFKEEGLEVEWLKFDAGAPEIAAMVSGDLHFGYIGQGALALCANGQADVVSISHYTSSEAILVRASSGIKTFEDLIGKKIGTEIGTSASVLITMACEKYGVDEKSLNIINMPIENAISAFIGGSIDAIVSWGADIYRIKTTMDEPVEEVVKTADFQDVVPFIGSWIAVRDYIEKNNDTCLRFIRALHKCYDYRYNNLDATIQAASEFGKSVHHGLTYEDLYSEKDQLIFFPVSDLTEWLKSGKVLNDYQLVLDNMIEAGAVEGGNVNDYVRVNLMKEALGIQ